jgi:hypothetical protein
MLVFSLADGSAARGAGSTTLGLRRCEDPLEMMLLRGATLARPKFFILNLFFIHFAKVYDHFKI